MKKLTPAQERVFDKLRNARRYITKQEDEGARAIGETLHFTTWHELGIKPDGTINVSHTWSGHAIAATLRCLAEKGRIEIVETTGTDTTIKLVEPREMFELRVRAGTQGQIRVWPYLADSEQALRDRIAEHYGDTCVFEILDDEDDAPTEPVTVREAGTTKTHAIEAAPNAESVAAAMGDRIAGELGAAEGSSERMQAARIIAAELGDVLGFVERCFGADIRQGGTDENIFEEAIRAHAGKLLTGNGKAAA